jgi:hypothetical protein
MWVRPSGRTCGLKPAPTCSNSDKKPVPEEHATNSSNAVIGILGIPIGIGIGVETKIMADTDSDSDPDGSGFSYADLAKLFLIFTKSSPILLS